MADGLLLQIQHVMAEAAVRRVEHEAQEHQPDPEEPADQEDPRDEVLDREGRA